MHITLSSFEQQSFDEDHGHTVVEIYGMTTICYDCFVKNGGWEGWWEEHIKKYLTLEEFSEALATCISH